MWREKQRVVGAVTENRRSLEATKKNSGGITIERNTGLWGSRDHRCESKAATSAETSRQPGKGPTVSAQGWL